jgi:hypothetical protein
MPLERATAIILICFEDQLIHTKGPISSTYATEVLHGIVETNQLRRVCQPYAR